MLLLLLCHAGIQESQCWQRNDQGELVNGEMPKADVYLDAAGVKALQSIGSGSAYASVFSAVDTNVVGRLRPYFRLAPIKSLRQQGCKTTNPYTIVTEIAAKAAAGPRLHGQTGEARPAGEV